MSLPGAPRQRGFTLLEVVVSIALFALLMSLVYGAFGTAVRAHDAGRQRTDDGSSMRVVGEFLRNSIAAAVPVAVAGGDDWAVLLEGDAQRLHYVTDLPGHVGAGGLHEIVVELQAVEDHQELVMRRRPLVLDDEGQPTGEYLSRILLPDAKALAVRFYGARDEGEPRWLEAWAASRLPPLLVELVITPRDGDPWPALRVRPRGDNVTYLGNGSRRAPVRGQAPAPGAAPATEAGVPVPDSGAAVPAPAAQ